MGRINNAINDKLRRTFRLENSPVAIKYADEPTPGGSERKIYFCTALKLASQGAIMNLSKRSCSCPGGRLWLGLDERPRGLAQLLSHREGFFCSPEVAGEWLESVPSPPKGRARYVLLSPLGEANFEPDVVVFLVSPWQASRLLGLAQFRSGVPLKISAFGAVCQCSVCNPIVTGKVEACFIDPAARKIGGYEPDELIISFPYADLVTMTRDIDRSGYV
ncbi:MAG: DUF169 domain-containing protein [Chloroflexota bacterium]